jgi:hypothetical protein
MGSSLWFEASVPSLMQGGCKLDMWNQFFFVHV